ncbi:alpha-2-macroglobulin family protein [Mangrovimonas spongiae]|uniref:Alpha-2-macroglobulin n=1 Tax=Mangrovimonas spongiae TaxID=2494697 RepID=A0A428K6K9_9FLAO|nr:MG2 domain-containing protein [Mangrovimonas spongiae]RSK42065.1 alpha-2-macroglobulin [Mangrovimonas spongiae]
MKHLTTLLMIILFAHTSQAQDNYQSLWKQVESFDNKGLPKSALKIVKQIENQAKKEDNKPQQIKTLLFKSKYALILEEEAQLNIINDFKTEISSNSTPTKSVLENMLATLYWQYFQQNRWRFYDRTKTSEKMDTSDFRTWDLQTLFEEIHCHYQNSLSDYKLLQNIAVDDFKSILTTAEGSKKLRPTLYDILAHNALSFYKTDENNISKPAYKFEIDNPEFLATASEFSTLNITSKDSTSLQLNALKLYQNLTIFHVKKQLLEALVEVDIERLNFVYGNSTFPNKDALFLKTLNQSIEKYKGQAISGFYAFEKAKILQQQGHTYNAKINEDNRWKLKEALAICNNYIFAFPKSRAAKKLEVLKEQILNEQLQITTETQLPINTFSKVLVRYKNLNALNFKIYNASYSQIKAFNKIYREDKKQQFINKLSTNKQFTNKLKNENDYQLHTTEVSIPKLDNGHYIITANVNNTEQTFAAKTIQVTNLAIIELTDDSQYRFQIINRNNGQPISGAKIVLTYQKNYNKTTFNETYTTDPQGFFSRSKQDNERLRNVNINVSFNNDTADFGEYYLYNYRNQNQENETQYRGFLFTDRSIYRPGQTVYFKGINTIIKNGTTKINAGQAAKIRLKNVNGEVVNELLLKTNDYGSVSGEFILPNNGLTGSYSLDMFCGEYTYTNISVEEYKRPKFETNFNPVSETFKVNDSVTVNGTAKAYAGSNISNAKVVYRVHRKVQFPRWYYWSRPWFNSEPQEITHGETTTNDKGEFDITFLALPDQSVNKENLPTFQYEVTADVTDINGETRSSTTVINVGYHALTAQIIIESVLDKTNKNHKLTIDTKNLNGEFVPATGTIKIYKLNAPKRVLRPRPWDAPDYQEIAKNEFLEKFPNEAYTNESDSKNWKKGELVFEKPFNTESSKELLLGNIKKWASGEYLITLETKDKFGQPVKDQTRTTLYSAKDKTLADNQLFSITTDTSSYRPNDRVQITLGSSAKNMIVTLAVEKDKRLVKTEIITINNQKKTISVPVTKNDLGGFAVHYSYAFANSFGSGVKMIAVPYPKTDLEIETTTFRDKLQPGQDETWSFKIKGPKGEQVSAELLASMYDMSLDQFKPHSWNFTPLQQPIYNSYLRKNARLSFAINGFRVYNQNRFYANYPLQEYDELNWFGLHLGNRYQMLRGKVSGIAINEMVAEDAEMDEVVTTSFGVAKNTKITFRGNRSISGKNKALIVIDGRIASEEEFQNLSSNDILKTDVLKGATGATLYGSQGANGVLIITTKKADLSSVKIRKNLQETAFFYPQLQTDKDGNVSFSFTTPEALTQWKLQLLGHTKTLESTVTRLETVTQKELMVIPNAPRFLRHGDKIVISIKIANLSNKDLSGQAQLQLLDAVTGKEVTSTLLTSLPFDNMIPNKHRNFSVKQNGNTQIAWSLSIPENINAVQYKIIAKAGDFSDGEQNALPVLSNRMLVTETLPMWIKSNETRTFTLDKLQNNTSSTLKHHKLTLEMTSNPAWYAIQALPYLMEYPYDCNEQTFSRYYANALASNIANSNPRIQEVFNQWASQEALISNLEKNEDLKNILIQETPWLRDAQSETEQKKRIALLFDLNKMNNELQNALRKLKQNQMDNGAWPWFNGGRPNRFITQHIITGFGHLKHLNVTSSAVETSLINKAISYLDSKFIEEYNNLKKHNKNVDLSKDHLSYTQLHYLYMRSFFPEVKQSNEVQEISAYYLSQIQKYWLKRSLYSKGLMALITHRMNDNKTAESILKSLNENSITNDELGMYWKDNTASWHWYQAPIETQALMIEVFSEVGTVFQSDTKNLETIDNLKIWLLKNKQTNKWETTKATIDAVYALLLQGSDWLSVTEAVDVQVGGKQIDPSKLDNVKVEAGTGYFKTAWDASEITPEMANVTLTKTLPAGRQEGGGIAWGGLYWQYFEDLDNITSAKTPLSLKKKLFKKTNTNTGEVITEITPETLLEVGDLVRVRIELRSDRDMEFIHMKDMRASGLEPVNVLSQYKWQDGLGYYESTKDASTNFFFDYLPKGVYVFEYDLRVNNAGNMSNGITTLQSMYAPEFSSHSEGVRISVKN